MNWKKFIGFTLIPLVLFALLHMCSESPPPSGSESRPLSRQIVQKTYSEFISLVEKRLVSVGEIINDKKFKGRLKDDTLFETTILPTDISFLRATLLANDVIFTVISTEGETSLLSTIVGLLPMLIWIVVIIFIIRGINKSGMGSGGGLMGFGKSRARRLTQVSGRITFEDVAGIDEAKQELQEIIEFLRDPRKFEKLGGKIPKGCLLVGPPGTGKTPLARAVAGEANVPFFTISGSDFVEMFVGVGASRVRDMFEQGKKNAPCIIFMDEIDAMGRHRGAGLGGGNDEREQTLNQLLVEMDGFESNEGVILIAATNRPDVLDPALIRPGRFDRQIVVSNPDINGREQILRVHMKKVPLASNVNPRVIARGTPGFSGADLANLVNEAALLAGRKNQTEVTMQEFEDAKDKVMMGVERRSMVMTEKDKKITAYNEAGHALVTLSVPESDPLHKVTIIPRGRSLGLTMSLPEQDRLSLSLTQLTSKLAILYGGRVAEEMVFGKKHITTGASNDIHVATSWARRMVTEFGFSDKLGPVRYNSDREEIFLGHSVTQQKNVSDETAKVIDGEIHRFIDEAEKSARAILTEKRESLDILANALLEYETLSGAEIKKILAGEPIRVNGNGNGNGNGK
ncbi:MAG: ATP-dependent zinc metalloprotease FtsH [bacterium]|nr:ATP-dependent zinc metalloprotease FtsH [bacterium]